MFGWQEGGGWRRRRLSALVAPGVHLAGGALADYDELGVFAELGFVGVL